MESEYQPNFIALLATAPAIWPKAVTIALTAALESKEKLTEYLEFAKLLPNDPNEKELVVNKVVEIMSTGMLYLVPPNIPDPGQELIMAGYFYEVCLKEGETFGMSPERHQKLIRALQLMGSSISGYACFKMNPAIPGLLMAGVTDGAKPFLEATGYLDIAKAVGTALNTAYKARQQNARGG